MPRRTVRPRLSPRNVYVADYLTEDGLYRVYAITSQSHLLVLEDDAAPPRRYYRDVPLDLIDATVANVRILLDLKDPLTPVVSVRPKWMRLIRGSLSALLSAAASLPVAA